MICFCAPYSAKYLAVYGYRRLLSLKAAVLSAAEADPEAVYLSRPVFLLAAMLPCPVEPPIHPTHETAGERESHREVKELGFCSLIVLSKNKRTIHAIHPPDKKNIFLFLVSCLYFSNTHSHDGYSLNWKPISYANHCTLCAHKLHMIDTSCAHVIVSRQEVTFKIYILFTTRK